MSSSQSETCYWSGCSEAQYGDKPYCAPHLRWIIEKSFEQYHTFALKVRIEQDRRFHNNWGESDTVSDFRFSASYASRYNNCHGSANLEEALPGFKYPEQNESGMKGQGTNIHNFFELVVTSGCDLLEAAKLLCEFTELSWRERDKLMDDKKSYIIWWFMKYKTPPPIQWEWLDLYLRRTVILDEDKTKIERVPPRRLEFIAESLVYVHDILQEMDDDVEILVEVKMVADWLVTQPKTTVDMIIKDSKRMHVLDLKSGDIEVSPIKNEQLMYYGKTFGAESYDKVTLHIMQRNNTDYWELQPEVLSDWVDTVKVSEQAIMAGDLSLTPGSHCEFCPANPRGRGDKGNVFCHVMLRELYGERDAAAEEESVLEGDDDDE